MGAIMRYMNLGVAATDEGALFLKYLRRKLLRWVVI